MIYIRIKMIFLPGGQGGCLLKIIISYPIYNLWSNFAQRESYCIRFIIFNQILLRGNHIVSDTKSIIKFCSEWIISYPIQNLWSNFAQRKSYQIRFIIYNFAQRESYCIRFIIFNLWPNFAQRECISVHVGQAGCQIGNACWELYCLEHGIYHLFLYLVLF